MLHQITPIDQVCKVKVVQKSGMVVQKSGYGGTKVGLGVAGSERINSGAKQLIPSHASTVGGTKVGYH